MTSIIQGTVELFGQTDHSGTVVSLVVPHVPTLSTFAVGVLLLGFSIFLIRRRRQMSPALVVLLVLVLAETPLPANFAVVTGPTGSYSFTNGSGQPFQGGQYRISCQHTGYVDGSVSVAVTPSSPDVLHAGTLTLMPLPAGHITYRLPDDHVYRLSAQSGAMPQDVSTLLNSLSPGSDTQINLSPDGQWLVLNTTRFDMDCQGWECLAVVAIDLQSGDAIRINGQLLHGGGGVAVASGGDAVVYSTNDGPHFLDLWIVRRQNGLWSEPVMITGASPHAWNDMPALSADGNSVLFDCGPEPYGAEGTAICEVNTDGTGFRTVITPQQGPGGTANNALHHPDYAPDDSIVFEADWFGEQIWKLPSGSSTPTRITDVFGNDNSPCVLPDGRIASLWLGRQGGQGYHELKVMNVDGSGYQMLLINNDIQDIGLGCGE